MIPDDVVDEVRLRADLVEIVGGSVPLKRSGKEWKGKCPFHDDRTPSFYVVPAKGFYKCFGCGESGDVFTFLMKRQGMDFLDAVRHLGERYGVAIRETRSSDGGEDDPLRAYYETNAFARDWFRERLLDPEDGKAAREYLQGRGVDDETVERFGLGWAPDAWDALKRAAAKHEIPEEHLRDLGLLATSERRPEPYDRFRNRIIFPIQSVSGRVVAFGGRVLGSPGKGAPKYVNSPESPVYEKGAILYALGWNRNSIRQEGVALVVEGYMDVVALGAAGVDHAVATLGTALTEKQAQLLRRYAARAVLLFDSDEAGVRATFRAADVLLAQGVHPSVVSLPDGEDPDTLVRSEGVEGLRRRLDDAVEVLDRKLQLLDERGYFGSIDRVRLAVDKLLPTLRAVKDPALRDIYVSRVAERTGVRRETLEAEVASGRTVAVPQAHRAAAGERRRPKARLQGFGAERQLLLVLLRSRSWVDRAAERIGPEEFRDPVHRAIFKALLDDPELDASSPGMSPEVARRLEELLGDPEPVEHTERMFEESVAELFDRPLQARKEALERDLREASSEEEQRRVLEELSLLRRERRGRWNVIRRD